MADEPGLVPELRHAGHQVVCLARSDASTLAVKTAGAEMKLGDLADLDVRTRGASLADGVMHLGFIHDFANFAKSAETDRAAIQTMAAALAGSNRPLVATSGAVTRFDASPRTPVTFRRFNIRLRGTVAPVDWTAR